jgi:4-hydroxybenzoate polyprenyltransferase
LPWTGCRWCNLALVLQGDELAEVAGAVAYQQYLIRSREREGCFRAFLNNNWLGAMVFAGMLLDYMVG